MRICLISREYPPETGWGGIATFSYHLAHGLHELGHEVHVICLAEEQARRLDDEGVTIHRVLPYAVPGQLGAMAMPMPYSRTVVTVCSGLWQKFQELHEAQPFDVVDSPELLAESIFPAVTRSAPLVIRLYTPHFKFMAEQLHNITGSFDHQFVSLLERVALLQADAITSPSEDLAQFVAEDLHVPQRNIRIIYNPIDPKVFSPDGPCALEQTESKRVLFVGRLEERKGISYLVHAIPQILEACPDTEFVIIGPDTINSAGGQRSVLNDLREFLAKSHVLSKVKFITRVPLAELPSYYRSADICVVPSVYDNSPYTCLEAMACGRPVVGTSAGGTKEYVKHSECGIIVPARDSEALSAAIISVLKDGRMRARMGTAARQRVLDKFQRQQIARETVALYEEARKHFTKSSQSLYLKASDQALSDAAVLLFSFDRMIYDLLYRESIRFRIRHWWRLAAARPRLFAARVLLQTARVASNVLMPRRATPPALIRWLEQQINDHQEDPFASVRNTSRQTQR